MANLVDSRQNGHRVARPSPRPFFLLVMGATVIAASLLTYPGSWTTKVPSPGSSESEWTVSATLVYIGLILGTSISAIGIRRGLRASSDRSSQSPPWLQSLAAAISDSRTRGVLLATALLYAVFFSLFTGVLTVAWDGSISAPSFPAGSDVLCCGPPGLTPGLVLMVSPYLQLTAVPLTLLVLVVSVPIFSANIVLVTVAFRLTRGPASAGPGILGTLGAVLVGCPSCGTLLLLNALEGTVGAGLVAGWVAYQTPLLFAALPASGLALYWSSRRLASTRCRIPSSAWGPSPPTF